MWPANLQELLQITSLYAGYLDYLSKFAWRCTRKCKAGILLSMTIGHAPPPTAALFLLHLHDFYGIEIETYAEGSSLFTSCNSVPRNSWGHYARLSSTTSQRATGTYKQVARALSGPSMACCAAVLALAANRDVVLYATNATCQRI